MLMEYHIGKWEDQVANIAFFFILYQLSLDIFTFNDLKNNFFCLHPTANDCMNKIHTCNQCNCKIKYGCYFFSGMIKLVNENKSEKQKKTNEGRQQQGKKQNKCK